MPKLSSPLPVHAAGPSAPAAQPLVARNAASGLAPMGTYRYTPGTPAPRNAAAFAGAAPPRGAGIGLPAPLKAGVEALSGICMDGVTVHYRSSKPAQVGARAYALGQEIHLGPGQERHLPHETWHLAQQALGEVAPTMRLANGVAVNANPALEHEADRMGDLALRAGRRRVIAPAAPTRQPRTALPARGAVMQRKPENALKLLDANAPVVLTLTRALANARSITGNFPLILSRTKTYKAIKIALNHCIDSAAERATNKRQFLIEWNKGVAKSKVEYYTKAAATASIPEPSNQDGLAQDPRSGLDDAATERFLDDWMKQPLRGKSSGPDGKLSKLMPLVLAEPQLPDSIRVALKLFFAHTANFQPTEGLGRDFRAREHGQYYRSSLDPVRKGNSKLFRDHAQRTDPTSKQGSVKGQTFQSINRPLHTGIAKIGTMHSNIHSMSFLARNAYARYVSGAGSHTGSLGLIQNVYRTVQAGTDVELHHSASGEGPLPESEVPALLKPIVGEALLATDSRQNYHDLLLSDRSALVADLATAIAAAKYVLPNRGRVVPIQSPEHASLILELVYPVGTSKDRMMQEKAWRETFIETFNQVARQKKVQTRVTHRGSFGFLYPSVSSVGGPVRIWPGLTPPAIFKDLLMSTLHALANAGKSGYVPPRSAATASTGSSSSAAIALHREALKSAVRYAQDSIGNTASIKGPPRLAKWVAVRLQRNLVKARFLLQRPVRGTDSEQEQDYLKSASVIENLMEYSYLLEAMNANPASAGEFAAGDAYPAYLRSTLLPTAHDTKTATFYLDSGMQAIVGAHLLASTWTRDGRPPSSAPLQTIDLYSYFEYAAVDKANLNLNALNRSKDGYMNWCALDTLLGDREKLARDSGQSTAPSIIAADLNPVLTSSAAKSSLIDYRKVFARFAGKDPAHKNAATIPIVDVTNASLAKVAEMKLHERYENYIVVESLSKHQQLGADKFTMGRLNVVGSAQFIDLARTVIGPIEEQAFHRLPAAYRLRMDRVFYGDSAQAQKAAATALLAAAPRYDAFMESMGRQAQWNTLDKRTDGDADTLQARYAAAKTMIAQTLEWYVTAVIGPTPPDLDIDLGKAYASLPLSDQNGVRRDLEQRLSPHAETEVLTENPYLLRDARGADIGITNAGNTCFLAAALNTLAFTPYRELFAPRPHDPHAVMRAQIHRILTNIVNGQRIPYADVLQLLSALDAAQLLEGPIALAAPQPLNAQRDPAEVMDHLLDLFGAAHDPRYRLEQRHERAMALPAIVDAHADAANYSAFDAQGRFAERIVPDWLIKLPIAGVSSLAQAMHRYQLAEPLERLSGVSTADHRVYRGNGSARTRLGTQTPEVVAIQLVRWYYANGRVIKDARPLDMPDAFILNGWVYALQTIIHHHGAQADAGHYTTSTRGGDGAWQYRDDRSVYADPNIANKKDNGYLYSYVRQGAAGLDANLHLLDLMHPLPHQAPSLPPHSGFGSAFGPTFGPSPSAAVQPFGGGGTPSNLSGYLASLVAHNPDLTVSMDDVSIQLPLNDFVNAMSKDAITDTASFYKAAARTLTELAGVKRMRDALGDDWTQDRATWEAMDAMEQDAQSPRSTAMASTPHRKIYSIKRHKPEDPSRQTPPRLWNASSTLRPRTPPTMLMTLTSSSAPPQGSMALLPSPSWPPLSIGQPLSFTLSPTLFQLDRNLPWF
ncbi:hypothetical protein NRY95_10935 [Xanthomonas campestris pv. phormiicola]|nr:hypothetical protein [Xanthomonas campestris pv. phormiicola]UYC18422.1 hypothetical protein NRY95_10935 [Xanthomonas campestris pv. phormiicola]